MAKLNLEMTLLSFTKEYLTTWLLKQAVVRHSEILDKLSFFFSFPKCALQGLENSCTGPGLSRTVLCWGSRGTIRDCGIPSILHL